MCKLLISKENYTWYMLLHNLQKSRIFTPPAQYTFNSIRHQYNLIIEIRASKEYNKPYTFTACWHSVLYMYYFSIGEVIIIKIVCSSYAGKSPRRGFYSRKGHNPVFSVCVDTTQQLLCGNSVGEERWEACLRHGTACQMYTQTQYNHAHVKAGKCMKKHFMFTAHTHSHT